MDEVVSPRGVTYRVTCHQWLRKGESSMRTLPTICVHMCSVWQVSRHASYCSTGQPSIRSPYWVLIVSSIFCSTASPLAGFTLCGELPEVQPTRHRAPRNRYTGSH